QPQQRREPLRLAGRWSQRMVGQEADRAGQPLADRWRIAEAAPVDPLEAGRKLLGQPGGQDRLANAANAQERHQSAAILQHPAPEYLQLYGAAHEAEHVRGLAPVLAALWRATRGLAPGRRRPTPVASTLGPCFRSAALTQYPGERYGVERGAHAGRAA